MYILLFLLIIAAAVLVAVFFKPVVIAFLLDTNHMDMYATADWMPSIRVEIRIIDYRLSVTVSLFRKNIYTGFLKHEKKGRAEKLLIESLQLSNTAVKIAYGFQEPYLTGIFSAAADFAAALIRTADIELAPVFNAGNDFLRIDAKTELNAGKTLINMLRKKFARTGRRKNYGSAQFN